MQNELLRVEFDGNVFHIRNENTNKRIKKYLLSLVRGESNVHRTAWTPEEDQYLVEHQNDPLTDQAKAIGRTKKAVSQHRMYLGVANRPIVEKAKSEKVFEV